MLAVEIDLQILCGLSDSDKHDTKATPHRAVRSMKTRRGGNSGFVGGRASKSTRNIVCHSFQGVLKANVPLALKNKAMGAAMKRLIST
jgi:hypothetical protein